MINIKIAHNTHLVVMLFIVASTISVAIRKESKNINVEINLSKNKFVYMMIVKLGPISQIKVL